MSENIYSLSIFKGVERGTIDEIILSCEEKLFNKGEMILAEGEESNGEGYIIKNGSVTVSIKGQKIVELNTGNMFGEIALLNEEQRTATVTSNGETQVIVLKIDDLINMINNDDNSINKEIMRRIEENINFL